MTDFVRPDVGHGNPPCSRAENAISSALKSAKRRRRDLSVQAKTISGSAVSPRRRQVNSKQENPANLRVLSCPYSTGAVTAPASAPSLRPGGSHPFVRDHRGSACARPTSNRTVRYAPRRASIHSVRGASALRPRRLALHTSPHPRTCPFVCAVEARLLAHNRCAGLHSRRQRRGRMDGHIGPAIRRRHELHARHLESSCRAVSRVGALRELQRVDRADASRCADPGVVLRGAPGRLVVARVAADISSVRMAVSL